MNNQDHKRDQSDYKKYLKILFFPVTIISSLSRLIGEKTNFSIRLKLSLRYIKILLGAMVTAGLGILIILGAFSIEDAVSRDYRSVAEIFSQEQISYSDAQKVSEAQNIPISIYDLNGNLLFASQSGLAEYSNIGYKIGYAWTPDTFYMTVNRSVMVSGILGKVVIYSDLKDQLAELLWLIKVILIVFGIVLFFAIISIVQSGKGIFQPIREMTETVKVISEQNLNLRLNVSGSKNELKELALTFNEMMNRIEDNYNRQRQFVSDASHELRTPIAVIQGYAVMLDRWGKNDQEVLQESITAIKNESENMQELIDKLLFLARHDNSTFEFQKEEFSLTEMLQEIVKETQIIDSCHKITSQINQEVSLYADKNRMKQAIRIFMDNAIKYTPLEGEITVTLGREDGFTAVSIKDTGIGMTDEDLKRIFDRFYRADQSRTKEKGGHGLGLAIAKIIILGHQGKIKVRSKLGEGSEFIILLKNGSVGDT